ncbi:nuclear transport factor 2 family protein [Devosia ginsengisoli]|uniref:nuclear transport factor 2 family protein n=1 Tax=Devosia ginsengisoli TaxID=400770 RepID=UPI0026EE8980|nr:nuclear transport factor 2 family protein [Devosia ginsengisoli]MCR6670714.1 nuclear transport factor 2 family protein [Devosia ginsengisoli]
MNPYSDPLIGQRAEAMERTIRTYFDGCNEADADKIMACLTEDAVHYFPPGMYQGPFRGARTIADRWIGAVRDLGSYWSVDTLLIEPVSYRAVMEWTHFKTKQGKKLRGDEWYGFDAASGRIKEIRAYYASPQAADLTALELGGFDYAGRGYPAAPPPGAR